MKYSINAQCSGKDISAGHLTASSALDGVAALKERGAAHIQIIDAKTGRLIDEAALARANVEARQMARLRRPGG